VEAYRVQQRGTVGAGGVGRRRAVLVAEGDAEQQPMIVSKAETAAHDRRVQAEHALRAQAMPREVSASIRVCAYMPMSVASRVSNSRCMKTNTACGASKNADVHAHQPPALVGEALCDRQADAARRAGDDADLRLRAGRHEPLTCSSPALDAASYEMVH
jgi:hypothetical protein